MTIPPVISLPYPYPQAAPNEPVTLQEGFVLLRDAAGKEASGPGQLVLRCLPTPDLRLRVNLSGLFKLGDDIKSEMMGGSGDAIVTAQGMSAKDGIVSSSIEAGLSSFEIGATAELTSAGFQVLNFTDFLTPGAWPSPAFGFPPKAAELQAAGWRVRLSAVEKSDDVFKALGETGGYAFTHVGQIERSDGAPFMASEVDAFLDTLARFLSFARGAACSLPVRWGHEKSGGVAWQRWGSPIVDAWKSPHNWFEEHHGGLLQAILPAFVDTTGDAELGDAFKLALHWYRSSNLRSGGMEGAIILGLTSLDLLAALVVVDRAKDMPEKKFDVLGAAVKLRKLLEKMKVPLEVPPQLKALTAFAATNGWTDAAKTLAEIRHSYVHANSENRKIVFAAPNLATCEAWQLSVWYQELALLWLLNHAGEYRNRLTADYVGVTEKVPWA
jgi:hypothetical protein